MDDDERNDPVSGFASLRHRLRYRFDNVLARGTSAVLVWLGLVTLAAVVVAAILLRLFDVELGGAENASWIEDFWQSLLRILDTGTMAGDVGWGRRLLALAITIFGLLVAGTLIGVIATGVEDRIDQMRRGRSVVIEHDHIVVLGSSPRVPALVEQLVLAGRRHSGRVIVVMADRDPTEMMDEVNELVDDRLGTRLVYRSGDPTRRGDLELVRLHAARTVIVLADDEAHDTAAVRTVFAAGAELGGFDRIPIVVEVKHRSTAERLSRACGSMVHPILPEQATARCAVFALLDVTLMRVVDELLDFRGCDLYVREDPELVGLAFHEIGRRFDKARPIGRVRPDGSPELNPSRDAVFERGDRLVVIADDDDDLQIAPTGSSAGRPSPRARSELHHDDDPRDRVPDHLLVIGWSPFGAELIENWAGLASPASTVEVMLDPRIHDPSTVRLDSIEIEHISLTAGVRPVDRIVRPDGRPPITTIVLLTDIAAAATDADMDILLELAELRSALADDLPRCVLELRDVTSSTLIDFEGNDDYVVSDAIGSRFIAQLADLPERRRVYLDLYDSIGPTLHLEPSERLGLSGDFRADEVFEATSAAGSTALGWWTADERRGGLVLNPHVSDRVELRPGDKIVVVG